MTPSQLTLAFSVLEEWRVVEEFPNYEISNFGQVRRRVSRTSGKAGHILHQYFSDGYKSVVFQRNRKSTSRYVHRLVALAFIPPVEGLPDVNHVDTIRSNNHVSNLEWCNQQGNVIHAYAVGVAEGCSGEDNGQAKLTWEDVKRIRSLYKPYVYGYRRLGKQFNVSFANIAAIITGRSWGKWQ